MNRDELKLRVMAAIESTWPAFEAEHPMLAQVVDQAVLGEHVVEALSKDADFQKAYEQAVEAKVGAAAFSGLLGRFVEVVLARFK